MSYPSSIWKKLFIDPTACCYFFFFFFPQGGSNPQQRPPQFHRKYCSHASHAAPRLCHARVKHGFQTNTRRSLRMSLQRGPAPRRGSDRRRCYSRKHDVPIKKSPTRRADILRPVPGGA